MTPIVLKKNITLKLSTKGTILVAIPLTVQIISVVVMSLMLWSSEAESVSIDQARDITSESLYIAKLIWDTEYEMYSYVERVRQGIPNPPILLLKYEEKKKAIQEHLHELWSLSKNRPKERPIVTTFIKRTKGLIRLLDQIKENLDQSDMQNVFSLGIVMSRSQQYLPEISDLVQKLSVLETKDKPQARVEETRHLIQYILFASVALNVLVVCGLLIQFNKGTISRLSVLMDNTRRLANHQTLNPQLDGMDEIGELDRVFHEAAAAMEAAKKREMELMDLKKQIMAMVSHDLRAPLSSLQITLDMLQNNMLGELPELARAKVVSSEQSVSRLIRMINDLLDVEKLESGKMDLEKRDVPVLAIVERSLEAVAELAKAKNLEFVFEPNELELQGDGDRLIQVLINIVSNAIKFSPEDGEIQIISSKKAELIELRVTDCGPGIPDEERKQIFERFRQVKGQKRGGTGLGLAISKLIVELHGGQIGVDAAEGGGSSFWFTIPAAQELSEEDLV